MSTLGSGGWNGKTRMKIDHFQSQIDRGEMEGEWNAGAALFGDTLKAVKRGSTTSFLAKDAIGSF